MTDEKRIAYLEKRVSTIKTVDIEKKYRKKFEAHASYLGHGVYEWQGLKATDSRELFLLGVLVFEGIKFNKLKTN